MKSQINTKYLKNPEGIFKSAKNFLEKLSTKKDYSKTTKSKVLRKTPNRKKTPRNNRTFASLIFL